MGNRGFTVLEIVAASGILLLIGIILLPLGALVRTHSENVTCVSNLRQIGMGIVQYSTDHSGTLPGPLISGQYPWWGGSLDGGDPTQLASYVASYLSLGKTRTKRGGDDVFVCPAYKRAMKNRIGDSPVYRMNVQVSMQGNQGPCAPFGYPNSQYPALFNTTKDYPPMRAVALSQIVDSGGRPAMSSTWAMKDIDESDPIFGVYTHEFGSGLPRTMVHRTHRNALFFDFHVEPIDRSGDPGL